MACRDGGGGGEPFRAARLKGAAFERLKKKTEKKNLKMKTKNENKKEVDLIIIVVSAYRSYRPSYI